MAYSDNFPATRPVFMADFANGGKIDPRATFTRSDTPPTYAAPSAVHYWSNEKHLSSENLLRYSNPNDAAWTEQGSSITLNQAASPDATTTASLLTEDSSTGVHRGYQSIAGNSVSGQTYTFVGYFKSNGRTLVSAQFNGSGITTARVEFDLSSSGTATSRAGSPANLSISQIGSTGWYKCSFQATATGAATMYLNVYLQDGADSTSYTGDGTSGVYAWGCNVSTTGQLAHEDTTTQIHRSYAPTLKSVATAGQPRFEYDPSTDGQSIAKGILIEGQSQNLVTYGIDFASWAKTRTAVEANAAIGPDGTLSADLMREDNAAHGLGTHFVTSAAFTTSLSTQYTMSVYAKRVAGSRLLQLRVGGIGSGKAYVNFDLGDGTVEGSGGTVLDSSSISSVGNGWHRCSLTFTNASSGSTVSSFYVALADTNTELPSYTADEYSGFALYGAQVELGSMSSLVATTSSAVTRASESLSMDLTQAGFNGGPFTIVSETEGGQGPYPRAWALTDSTASERVTVYRNAQTSGSSTDWYVYSGTGGSGYVTSTIPSSASAGKVAVSFDTNDVSFTANGNSASTDPSAPIPSGLDTLKIGTSWSGGSNHLNGHIKRVALYNEALSDTNLQALTS